MAKISILTLLLISFIGFSQNTEGLKSKSSQTSINNNIEKEKAEFPGGDFAFRKMILETLNSSKYIGNKKTSCLLSFTVTEKGEMTDLITFSENHVFSNDLLQVIYKTNPKWKPAKINGKEVRSSVKVSIFYE